MKTRKRTGIGWLTAVSSTCLLAAGAARVQQPGNDTGAGLDRTRSALEQYVQTRRILSREKRDWVLGKEMLEERIALVRQEVETRRAATVEAQASIAEADKKRAELLETNERLKAASVSLVGTVFVIEGRTKALLARLPDLLTEKVKPLSQRIPDDPAETKLSLGERFQNVVGILNEVNKFNGEIAVTSEVRELSDGKTAEVTALYVGIGQGYYVSADGKAAGVGSASAEGWSWRPANESSPAIAKAIAILKNEEVASFVPLPVSVE